MARHIPKFDPTDPALLEAIQKEQARRSMARFALYTDPRYKMNWHHRLICDRLDQWIRHKIKRLMIFMPPRHGKSELVSRKLPAYIFGINPDASIIGTSYSADLATAMNRDVQRIIDSEIYNSLFPETTLNGSNIRTVAGSALRNSDKFEIVGHRGMYRSAGVDGGITGMGGDYIIIDDPIKNRQDANSQTMRQHVWDWYTSTLYTRLEKNACILITLTRWHEDDLAGRLLEAMKDNPRADQWEVLSLPATYEADGAAPYDERTEEGQALWPWKYNEQDLATIKSTLGSIEWGALYQQHPAPVEGSIFKREWLTNFYKEAPRCSMIIQSWDEPFTKSEGSAKCAGIVMGRKGADIYIFDLVNDKMEFTESVAAIRTLSAKWPQARAKVIENKANGPAIVSHLKKEIPGLVEFNPVGSKEERAISVTPYLEAGNLHLPDPAGHPWVHDFIEDLITFPNGTYKDTADAFVQGILYLMDKPSVSAPPVNTMPTHTSYWQR